jgi:hypothetical protein
MIVSLDINMCVCMCNELLYYAVKHTYRLKVGLFKILDKVIRCHINS